MDKLSPLQLLLGQIEHDLNKYRTEMNEKYVLYNKGEINIIDYKRIYARMRSGIKVIQDLGYNIRIKDVPYHKAITMIMDSITTTIQQKDSLELQVYGGKLDYAMRLLTVHDNPLSNFTKKSNIRL